MTKIQRPKQYSYTIGNVKSLKGYFNIYFKDSNLGFMLPKKNGIVPRVGELITLFGDGPEDNFQIKHLIIKQSEL